METNVAINSIEDLEAAIRCLDPRQRVVVSYVGAGSLFEAAVVFRILERHIERSRGQWRVDEAAMEAIRGAAEHYESLDLLEIQLDLVDLDLEAGITMRAVRFRDVRESANHAVTTAPPVASLSILDGITIEAQRVARITKALGFGAVDLELPMLTADDVEWLAADDVGAGEELQLGFGDLGSNGEPQVTEEVKSETKDGDAMAAHPSCSNTEAKAVEVKSEAKAVEVESEAKAVEVESEAKAVEVESEAKAVEVKSEAKAVEVQSEAKAVEVQSEANAVEIESEAKVVEIESDAKAVEVKSEAKASLPTWILKKEENVVAILRSKVAKVRAAIAAAKDCPVNLS